VRLAALLTLAAVGPCAFADRLIEIPTGIKTFVRTFKLDYVHDVGPRRPYRALVGVPIGQNGDAEVLWVRDRAGRSKLTFGGSYQLLFPITDISPGISVGVRDLMNRGDGGTSVFLALTYKIGSDGDTPTDLTLGLGSGGALTGPFGGASIPLSERYRLLVEADSQNLSTGVEWRPTGSSSLRWLFRERQSLVQAMWVVRF